MKRVRPTPAAASALLSLQRGLTGGRELAGSGYMDDPSLRAAYAEYYRAVSMAQTARILAASGIRPRSVLDMGAGPGSVSLAALDRGAREFHLVDSSRAALDMAASSIASAAALLGVSASVETAASDLEAPGAFPSRSFDLVAFGHCLNELGAGAEGVARRLSVVRRSASVIAPGGAVMVLEPATLAAGREALALRDALVAEGWRALAPCTRPGPCPALSAGPSHTCHDESAWDVPETVRRLAESAGLDRDLIKMTWYVVTPPTGEPSGAPSSAREPEADAYRVVSMPMLNKGGRVRYLLCGPGGRFPFSARKDDEAARSAGFFSLGRYDLVRIVDPEIREGGWGFGPGTAIRRLDALASAGAGKIE